MNVLRQAFSQPLNDAAANLVSCCLDDSHIIGSDIAGSIAHCTMLGQSGLITAAQERRIIDGLEQLKAAYESHELQLSDAREDVHMNVETELKQLIGDDALRLHTARSRNDQVALDMRLYTRAKISELLQAISRLQKALLAVASDNIHLVMPGYTHLQRAQPVLVAHALHAVVDMLERDCQRLEDCDKRACISPLGAGALAGTSLPVNPAISAEAAGMVGCFSNSIDAVSDRDFLVELVAACALCATHLSQLAETLVIWNTSEFGFVTFGDDVTTASSLMPNKKNPDPLEIIRATGAGATGNLVTLLTILKGLPLGYNRDLQSTKQPAIHCCGELLKALRGMKAVVESMQFDKHAMLTAAADPFLAATDLVELLVKAGVPFRQAHERLSNLVAYCRLKGKALSACTQSEVKEHVPEICHQVKAVFNPEALVALKTSPGGTAGARVSAAIAASLAKVDSRLAAASLAIQG